MPAFIARGQLQEIAKLIDSWIGQSDPRKPIISPDGTGIIAPGRLPDDDFISQTTESMVRSIRTYNELRLNKDNPQSGQEARTQVLDDLAISIIHQVEKFFHDRDNNRKLPEDELVSQKQLLENALSELRTLQKLISEDSTPENSRVLSRISSAINRLETYLKSEA